jgi:hypothetical protein
MSKGVFKYTLVPAAAYTTAETKTFDTVKLVDGAPERMMAVVDVTAAATAAGDILDVMVDISPDGGTTWINAARFTRVLGNGGAKRFFALLDTGSPGTSVIDASADCAAGAVRPTASGDAVRVRHTITSASAPSFTYSCKLYVL